MEAFISQTRVSYEFPNEIIYEKKLDTALRDTFLATFEERYKSETLSIRDRVMLSHIPKHLLKEKWDKGPTYMSYIMRAVLSLKRNCITEKSQRRQHMVMMDAMTKIIEVQLMNMMKNFEVTNKPFVIEKIRKRLCNMEVPIEIRALVHLSSWFTTIMDKGARCRRRQGRMTNEDYTKFISKNAFYEYPELRLSIIFGEGINVLILDEKIWVMPYAAIALIQNKLSDTISVLLFAYFSSSVSLPDETYDITLAFIKELALLLREYKNNFFTIAKSLESLCIAESIMEHEDWSNSEFLKVTSEDIFQDIGFDYLSSDLRVLIKSANTPLRHELCCLGKIMGHPYVDMRAGAKALHKRTTETYELNLKVINDCICHIKMNYIRNHVLRHKKWPPCVLDYGCSRALSQAYVRNKDPQDKFIVKMYGGVQLEDMNYVNLQKNDRFYKLENVIPYLKDKTITLLRSKVLNSILSQKDKQRPKWEETRLLLAYLLNPSLVHNHVDYIENYENSQDLEELLDYLVIRIVPKEKELKVEFRGFGCKTYEDRFRSLAQEKNAMRYLDDYSDEQAMTLSELEILRRLNTFRNLHKAYVGHKIIYINIDAKAWNNHFRSETVDVPMRETLDKVFGTSIYGKTHMAYEKTFFYVPGYPEQYSWKGQSGGIEGLNQDTWVVVYLGQIKTALDGFGFKYHCLCKGDDLRVAIAIPPHVWKNREMSTIKNDIVRRLAATMKSFGHQIKVMESYGSSKYFCFSKNASIENIELPQGFRKIQKCYGASNALIATLDEYIGSTFSNAHSTCKVEPNVLPAYIVALYWSLTYLINHPTYKHHNADELAALLLVPSLAGGFPIIYLHNMAVRAESDLLSPFLDLYIFARKSYPSIAKTMENFMHAPLRTKDDDPIMLYKDPYSIPHLRPALPSAVLRQFVLPILRKYAKQEDVKELLQAAHSPEMEAIKQVMATASVFNAKIQSALYSATPEGILSELTLKFESARSINELMIRSLGSRRATNNLRRVVRAERRLQIWRSNRVSGKHSYGEQSYSHLISECPAESADRIREYLWGRPIVGVTMPPLQHQVVLMTAFAITENKWINENHFTYTISPIEKTIDNSRTDHYASGPYKPFLGYTTRNGMTEPTIHFVEKDPMLAKIKNLLDLVTWTNLSQADSTGKMIVSNCPELIKLILGSYTSTSLDQLAPFSGIRRSGTIQHHVRAPSFRESIVPNVLSNVYTRVLGESNTHIRYRTSKHHYYANFLHIYCYSIWMSMIELEVDARITTPGKIWTVSSDCQFCNRMIVDEPIVYNMGLVRGMALHPLAISKIGQVAEEILKQSLDQHKDTSYNVDYRAEGTLPMEIAYQGILQEILEQTYMSRIALETRYSTPTLTDDAYQVLVNLIPQNRSRDVGQSEVKRIPIKELATYVAIVILHFSGKVKAGRLRMPRDSALSSTPAEALPWYGLIHQIHRAGKLPKLILHFSRFLGTPHATCFYNPGTASKFLCRYANVLIRFAKPNRPLVVLSYYTISHLTYLLEILITEKVLMSLRNDVQKYFPRRHVELSSERVQIDNDLLILFKESIILLSVLYNIDLIAGGLASLINEKKYHRVEGFGLEFLDITMVDDFIKEEEGYCYEIQDWLQKWEDLGLRIESVRDDEDWNNYLDVIQNRYQATHFDVHYTNIGACCMVVRSATVQDSEDSDEPERVIHQQIPVDPDQVKMNQMDRPCVISTGIDYTEPAMRGNIEYTPPSREMSAIPIYNVFCTLGSSTGSETHLLYILYNQEIYLNNNYPRIYACCLADGYGGFTSTLLKIAPNSTIIFHTLPQDIESPVAVPTVERDELDGIVLTGHLDEGYVDLTVWTTFERMIQYEQYNDFVTSDLELTDTEQHNHLKINLNIFKYYLLTRTRKCWSVVKLSINHLDDIGILYDLALHFCLYACLHSPRSSDSKTYVYLITSGWRKGFNQDEFDMIVHGGVSDYTTVIINRYVKQILSQWRKYSNLLNGGLDISASDPGFRNHRTMVNHTFQYRLPSLLLTEFDFPIIVEEREGLREGVTWGERLLGIATSQDAHPLARIEKSLGINTRDFLQSLWLELEDTTGDDRAVHRHAIICRILKVVGFRTVMKSYVNYASPMILKTETLTYALNGVFKKLRPRDRRGYVPPLTLHSDDNVHQGMQIHYISSFRRGITVGLVLLGTIGMFLQEPGQRKRIENKIKHGH